MKTSHFFSMFLIVLMSCDDKVEPLNEECLITKLTYEFVSGSVIEYSYIYEDNKLIERAYIFTNESLDINNTYNYKYEYYGKDRIQETVWYKDSVLYRMDSLTYNEDNMISIIISRSATTGEIERKFEYQYNENKQRIRINNYIIMNDEYQYNGHKEYEYVDNHTYNVETYTNYFADGRYQIYNYEYDNHQYYAEARDHAFGLFVVRNNRISETYLNNDLHSYRKEYNYEYNALGYPTSAKVTRTEIDINGNDVLSEDYITITYEYNCITL